MLVPRLKQRLALKDYGLIILDPVYKLLGERDENSNGDIANLMNELDVLAGDTGAALVIAHHFAKGDASGKEPMDRMSGAGAWARDPDSLVVLTPHEEKEAFTVSTVLRHMEPLPDYVVEWKYPLMRVAPDLNPKTLRSRGTRRKACTDREFHQRYLTGAPKSAAQICQEARSHGLSEATVRRYLGRLRDTGLVAHADKCFWSKATSAS